MGKIKLRCEIENLKSEMTCYVIDADMSYNLLLGRPWIHRNSIIPSTLHQAMKYAYEEGKVRPLIAEKYPFKGYRTISQTPSSTKILSRLLRIHRQKILTLVTKLMLSQNQMKNIYGN